MRFFVLSALCLFAVASAASVPDGLPVNYEEIQAETLKAIQDYRNEVMIDPEAALNKFMGFFHQFPITKNVQKRQDDDSEDLVAQTLKAYQEYVEEAKVNPEEALKKWNAFFESAGGDKVVEKRNVLEDVQGRVLMALAEHLSNTFRNKRDVREDIQNFLKDAQAKAKDAGGNFLKDARAKLMQALQQFLKDAQSKAANVGTEVQKAIDNLFDVAEKKVEESQNVAKRDVREDIQNFLKDAQAKAKDAGGNFLKDARAKLMQAVQQFLKDAQSKAANVGTEVQKAIDNLFDVAEKKVEESSAQAA